jgi:hypothetical protein
MWGAPITALPLRNLRADILRIVILFLVDFFFIRYDEVIMHRPIDRDAELEPDSTSDRRRLGRQIDVSPALLPLLRGTSIDDLHDPQADDEPDQLAAARGIVIWVLISAVLLVLSVKIIWFR